LGFTLLLFCQNLSTHKLMKLIADLHLHSKYSRAVSQQMVIPEIARWAKRKGIDLVGIPDWTHPLWLREVKNELVESGEGLFSYKDKPRDVFFVLATEVSSIYSQGGQTRRIHNLILSPSFEVTEKINQALRGRGANLLSDGRPIIGLSSIEVCDLVFSVSRECLIIPCHIWTPWFSLYGSRSGFDSIEECFGQFTSQIRGVETGLSSDPAMNWRIKELDNRSIVSFSDAHSPKKLGREVTVFEIEADKPSYSLLKKAIQEEKIKQTIEFYPEEGKYHYTGHRKCQVRQSPEETKKLGTTCPVCGRPLTVGVMHRVEELADRPADYQPQNRPPYKMLVPLMEILAEALGVGVASQTVETEYNRLVSELNSEFKVLLETEIGAIARISGEKVAEGVKRVREGKLVIDPGYDGVFGTVKIWGEKKDAAEKQMALF